MFARRALLAFEYPLYSAWASASSSSSAVAFSRRCCSRSAIVKSHGSKRTKIVKKRRKVSPTPAPSARQPMPQEKERIAEKESRLYASARADRSGSAVTATGPSSGSAGMHQPATATDALHQRDSRTAAEDRNRQTTAAPPSRTTNAFASMGSTQESISLRREVLQVRLQLSRAMHERYLAEAKCAQLAAELARQEEQGTKESAESTGGEKKTETSPLPTAAPLFSSQTAEDMLEILRQQDAAAHADVISLRYAHGALLASIDVIEMEVRRLLAIGLKPPRGGGDQGDPEAQRQELLDAIDAAAIESGARQLIRQNLALRLSRQAAPPLPTVMSKEKEVKQVSDDKTTGPANVTTV